MEKSANFNFSLPSRDNDTDIADINQISDNFRIIDSDVMSKGITTAELNKKVDKVSGKALSSNDFTDALNQKLNGIESGANKTITDSVLSTTSANPVENKVVTSVLNQKLNLSGGTMSGNIAMNGNDILTVKRIVFLTENGEWLNMGNHSITNLAAPTADHHAANKAYVDNALINIPKITVDTELSNTSENPVQNKVVSAAIKDSMPTLVTFNNADFTPESKTKIYLIASDAYLYLTASFDISRLNFVIPENADISIKNVLIDGEAIDLSLLNGAIESMENFTEDYGGSWIVRDNVYQNTHRYKFSSSTTAKAALDELQSSLNFTGFQLLINSYKQITAAEVEVK